MKKVILITLTSILCIASPIQFSKGGIRFTKNIKIEEGLESDRTFKSFSSNKALNNSIKPKNNKKNKTSTKRDRSIIDDKISLLIKAKKLLGKKYVYGAKVGDPNRFDCSSFTKEVYKELGINLPRVSRQQARIGKAITKNELQIGDLIFFNTLGNYISHVGMSIGDDKFVHASSKAGKIIVSDLKGYYLDRATHFVRVK